VIKDKKLIESAEVIGLFIRLNIHSKRNLPVRSSEMGLLIFVVENVVKNGASVTPAMAAEFFKVKKPMITAIVSSLTKQGYIIKIPSKEDKRSYTLTPTEKAIEIVEHAFFEYCKTLKSLRLRLGGDDFYTLIALIGKANAILLKEKENG